MMGVYVLFSQSERICRERNIVKTLEALLSPGRPLCLQVLCSPQIHNKAVGKISDSTYDNKTVLDILVVQVEAMVQ